MAYDPNEALKLKNQLCFPLYAAARRVTSVYTPYLKPLGLSVVFQLDEDNTVTLDLSRHESARLVIPLEELPERLRDTESILETLIAQSPDIYDQDEGY